MNLDETAHDGTHKKKGQQFLEAYAKCGCVAEACRLSGSSPSTHYWRIQHFTGYRKMFAQAHRDAITNAAADARRKVGEMKVGHNSTLSDT